MSYKKKLRTGTAYCVVEKTTGKTVSRHYLEWNARKRASYLIQPKCRGCRTGILCQEQVFECNRSPYKMVLTDETKKPTSKDKPVSGRGCKRTRQSVG